MGNERRRAGFSLIEILIVIAVLAIIASIAVPALLRARASANESSAIASMRAITSAQTVYAAACGGGGYAQSIADLALAPPGGLPFVEDSIPDGVKSGYTLGMASEAGAAVVIVAARTCNGSAGDAVDGYHATAVPTDVGLTGQRAFASNQRGAIFQNMTGVVIANPIPAGTATIE